MKTARAMLACLVILTATGALADDDCYVSMSHWQPKEAILQLAAVRQWTVRRIKIDDGCYVIAGRDEQGRDVEITLHPATLDVMEIEYENPDDDDDD